MTATQASLDALATHTRKRADAATARIEKALKQMRRQNAEITVSSVSRGTISLTVFPAVSISRFRLPGIGR